MYLNLKLNKYCLSFVKFLRNKVLLAKINHHEYHCHHHCNHHLHPHHHRQCHLTLQNLIYTIDLTIPNLF